LYIIVCPFVLFLLVIVLSVLLWFTHSDYPIGIFWSLCCLSFFDLLILITSLVSFGHCVVCPSLIYSFWLPHWYLLVIVLSVLLWFTHSHYPIGIFKLFLLKILNGCYQKLYHNMHFFPRLTKLQN
jgi:hypothetical protein